jgi:hypothetical protein
MKMPPRAAFFVSKKSGLSTYFSFLLHCNQTKRQMKKVTVLISIVVLSCRVALSQSTISAGGEIASSLYGTFSEKYGIGYGATGRYEVPFKDKLSIIGTAGFIFFTGKKVESAKYETITLIPIQAGVKYYFKESNKGIYASAEAGLFVATGGGSSGSDGGFSPGAGYRLGNFDFSGRVNITANTNSFGLRIGYIVSTK